MSETSPGRFLGRNRHLARNGKCRKFTPKFASHHHPAPVVGKSSSRQSTLGECPMAFQMKPGSGSLFKNDRKDGDNAPDYKGSIVDPEGNEFWLNGWRQ